MNSKITFMLPVLAFAVFGCAKNDVENCLARPPASELDCHYWAGTKKVFLTPNHEKTFIIFDGSERYDVIDPEKMDYHVFKMGTLTEDAMFRSGMTRGVDVDNIKCAVGTTSGFNLDNENILYKSNAYTDQKGNDVLISHLFYVRLKNADDYHLLETMAYANNVDIIGKAVEKLDLWYKLACTPYSDCDAVSMSARFYESGLFKYSEPDIMFDIQSCSKQPNSYPEYRMETRAVAPQAPNDPLFSQQWHLHNPGGIDINYLEAREITQGSSDITVMVIDVEEVTYNHPDLPDNLRGTPYVQDLHGTACVGIIGAKTNNGIGVAGIAPGCRILHKRIDHLVTADACTKVADALMSAHSRADVISCSWEVTVSPDYEGMMLLQEVFYQLHQGGRWHHDWTKELGTVIIFAAANRGVENSSWIAGMADLSVCAIAKDGKLEYSSCCGRIGAPGDKIMTTYPMTDRVFMFPDQTTEYCNIFGQTSSACPQVAAVAALVLSINPDLTYKEVCDYLTSTATFSGLNSSWTCYMGAGLLDAGAAVKAVLNDMTNNTNI